MVPLIIQAEWEEEIEHLFDESREVSSIDGQSQECPGLNKRKGLLDIVD